MGMVEMPQLGAWASSTPTPEIPPGSLLVRFPFPPGPPGYPCAIPPGHPPRGAAASGEQGLPRPGGELSSWQRVQ